LSPRGFWYRESPAHIRFPLFLIESDLAPRSAVADKRAWRIAALAHVSQALREERCLVVPAPPKAQKVKRYWNEQVGFAQLSKRGSIHALRHKHRGLRSVMVLQGMYEPGSLIVEGHRSREA
jgi:hypothetical protein